jgi:DNA-binding response OmpR family regulator
MTHLWPSMTDLLHTRLKPRPSARLPSCLIVEDTALISLSLETDLTDQGFTCAVVCSSSEALRWLDVSAPSVVILDYLLRDGPCTMLAKVLQARGVPFLIYSGFPAQAACSELRGTIWITKPADLHTIRNAVSSLVASEFTPRRV